MFRKPWLFSGSCESEGVLLSLSIVKKACSRKERKGRKERINPFLGFKTRKKFFDLPLRVLCVLREKPKAGLTTVTSSEFGVNGTPYGTTILQKKPKIKEIDGVFSGDGVLSLAKRAKFAEKNFCHEFTQPAFAHLHTLYSQRVLMNTGCKTHKRWPQANGHELMGREKTFTTKKRVRVLLRNAF